MEQTPLYDVCNFDLLNCIPANQRKIIDVGCMSGALAREYKKNNPNCVYIGIDIDPAYANIAKQHCDFTAAFDIESMGSEFYRQHADTDCWVFGDVLEHLKDPWKVLSEIRQSTNLHASVVACLPNAQNWSIIAKLALGDFRYEEKGLLDKTHLRWFTRQTIIELFESTGYRIEEMKSRTFEDPKTENPIHLLIGKIAQLYGHNASISIADSKAFQYVLRAVPK
jgi:2-polyprenyl-3-methyl-5-hydroxy-6-metoxy-1,4-benzoquinol methylase